MEVKQKVAVEISHLCLPVPALIVEVVVVVAAVVVVVVVGLWGGVVAARC